MELMPVVPILRIPHSPTVTMWYTPYTLKRPASRVTTVPRMAPAPCWNTLVSSTDSASQRVERAARLGAAWGST